MSVGFPDSIGWDEFATPVENWQLKYIDKVTGVGGKNFCNWVCGGFYGVPYNTEAGFDWGNFNNGTLGDASKLGAMMGPGGKCAAIAVNTDYLSKVPR
jgi:hypothetical protein